MSERLAFRMKLKTGCAAEYRRRHNLIWPELSTLLTASGITDYSIFLDEATGDLFGVQRCEAAGGSQELGENPIVRKWWNYMADLMEVNDDKSPVSYPLAEIFYLA